ncbi:MAG: hypothetical protein WCJ70_03115 [bacterium]
MHSSKLPHTQIDRFHHIARLGVYALLTLSVIAMTVSLNRPGTSVGSSGARASTSCNYGTKEECEKVPNSLNCFWLQSFDCETRKGVRNQNPNRCYDRDTQKANNAVSAWCMQNDVVPTSTPTSPTTTLTPPTTTPPPSPSDPQKISCLNLQINPGSLENGVSAITMNLNTSASIATVHSKFNVYWNQEHLGSLSVVGMKDAITRDTLIAVNKARFEDLFKSNSALALQINAQIVSIERTPGSTPIPVDDNLLWGVDPNCKANLILRVPTTPPPTLAPKASNTPSPSPGKLPCDPPSLKGCDPKGKGTNADDPTPTPIAVPTPTRVTLPLLKTAPPGSSPAFSKKLLPIGVKATYDFAYLKAKYPTMSDIVVYILHAPSTLRLSSGCKIDLVKNVAYAFDSDWSGVLKSGKEPKCDLDATRSKITFTNIIIPFDGFDEVNRPAYDALFNTLTQVGMVYKVSSSDPDIDMVSVGQIISQLPPQSIEQAHIQENGQRHTVPVYKLDDLRVQE